MLVLIKPPGFESFSKMVHSYPSGNKSLATVKDAGPAPIRAIFFPFFTTGTSGNKSSMSPLLS